MAKKKSPTSENPPEASETAALASPATDSTEAAADAAAVDDARVTANDCMPESTGRRDDNSFTLLLEACEAFNVDPRIATRPRELAAWRYYPGDRVDGVEPSVVLVTAGGLKLRYPVAGDAETEERLRAVFGAFAIDPVTKERKPAPLPRDLTLPAAAVTGQPQTQAHRHQGGYLRRQAQA